MAILVFFFFQAEDGIRDLYVTGVQTCALPISPAGTAAARQPARTAGSGRSSSPRAHRRARRSEERRVGKECRSRGSPYHYKKKKNPESAFEILKEGLMRYELQPETPETP